MIKPGSMKEFVLWENWLEDIIILGRLDKNVLFSKRICENQKYLWWQNH